MKTADYSTLEGVERRGRRGSRGEEVPSRGCTGKEMVQSLRLGRDCRMILVVSVAHSPWEFFPSDYSMRCIS